MVKVIETNISIDDNGEYRDHQSRIIEVTSWQDMIEEVSQNKAVARNSYYGGMSGCTIPRMAKVENLIYDDNHLWCDITTYNGLKTRKFLYLV